jgi:hypothetical protein
MMALSFPQRVFALAIVFAVLSIWHFRRDPHRWKEYLYVMVDVVDVLVSYTGLSQI